MTNRYRRSKSVDPRLYRTEHWAESNMAATAEMYTRGNQHLKYIPQGDSLYRCTTAAQTDLTPEFTLPALPQDKGTMTDRAEREDTVIHTLRPRSEMPRPEPSLRGDPYSNFYRRMADDLARVKPNLHNGLHKEPGPPVFRSGRLGAPWRHIRQCTGNLGNHICFVDGQQDGAHRGVTQSRNGRLGPWNHVIQTTGNLGNHITFINPSDGVVKQGDMESFPPYGYNDASNHLEALAYITPRTAGYTRVAHPMLKSAMFMGGANGATPRPHNKLRTAYNQRAKQNFKYWHEEKPYQGLPAKQTITGRLMAKGIGY